MKISIITVSFNSAKTIADTIKSVAGQDYNNIEYIIIDGASTDNTLDILNDSKLDNIKVISEPDNGIYDAMNKGIGLATGDVVGFLNADDFYPNQYVITKVAESFAKFNTDSCHGDLVYVSADDTKSVRRYWKSSNFSPGLFAKGWSPPHPTFFVKKSIYQQYGGFDLSLSIGNDIELMLRLLERHQITSYYIPEILVTMRLGGVSNRSIKNIIQQNKVILKSFAQNQQSVFLPGFIIGKFIDRLGQFLVKPKLDALP